MKSTFIGHKCTIVLVGQLNPAIFTPGWLASHEMISADEAENADLGIIHPDISQFKAGPFLFECTRQRFSISISEEPFVKILDITRILFTDYLKYTPLFQLGINLDANYNLPTPELRLELGRRMAPVAPWGNFGKTISAATPPGGMLSLTMTHIRPSEGRGYRTVTVQPNMANAGGVLFNINDHYEASSSADLGAMPAIEIMVAHFEESVAKSREIISEVIQYAEELR